MKVENIVDSFEVDVTEVSTETTPLLPEGKNAELARELELALKDSHCRQTLVRFYSVLLEVDMRNNPELYQSEE